MVNSAPKLPLHIPSLDGMRAISIGLVIVAHAASTHGAPIFFDRPAFTSLGNIGVRFFFVISGFLISTLLLRDIDRHGKVRLSTFYVRRVLRIMPAVLFYIAVMWALYLAGFIDLTYHHLSETYAQSAIPDLIHALTFTANYQLDYNWYFNHLWSLSVEEQFYLIWPFGLFFFGVRRAAWGAAAMLIVAPAIRMGMYLYGNGPEIALSREFQAVCDSLAMGCLSAVFYNRLADSRLFDRLTRWPAIPLGGLAIAIGYGSAYLYRPFAYIAGQTIANIGIALLLLHVVRHASSPLGRVLNSRPFVAVGMLSYSLYLWQEPFLYFRLDTWATRFPQNIAFAFAAAVASYFLIERPFLVLKDRLFATRRVTPASSPSTDSTAAP